MAGWVGLAVVLLLLAAVDVQAGVLDNAEEGKSPDVKLGPVL